MHTESFERESVLGRAGYDFTIQLDHLETMHRTEESDLSKPMTPGEEAMPIFLRRRSGKLQFSKALQWTQQILFFTISTRHTRLLWMTSEKPATGATIRV